MWRDKWPQKQKWWLLKTALINQICRIFFYLEFSIAFQFRVLPESMIWNIIQFVRERSLNLPSILWLLLTGFNPINIISKFPHSVCRNSMLLCYNVIMLRFKKNFMRNNCKAKNGKPWETERSLSLKFKFLIRIPFVAFVPICSQNIRETGRIFRLLYNFIMLLLFYYFVNSTVV